MLQLKVRLEITLFRKMEQRTWTLLLLILIKDIQTSILPRIGVRQLPTLQKAKSPVKRGLHFRPQLFKYTNPFSFFNDVADLHF